MKYKIRRFLFVGVWILTLIGVGFSWTKLPGLLDEITYKEGLRTLNDEPISTLDQAAQGRPILIEIQYVTACPSCIKEIEYLKRLDLPKELVMVMLTNVKESKARVRAFVKDYDIPEHWTIAVGGTLMAAGTPYTRIFIISSEGWQLVKEEVGWDGRGKIFTDLKAAIEEGMK